MVQRLKRGWRMTRQVSQDATQDNLSIVSAGVAFYTFLAIFPALAALVSIYGLVTDPAEARQQLTALGGVLPAEAQHILATQMQSVASSPRSALGLGVAGGILLALWSASKGTKSLMTALNIAYDTEEKRGFLRLNAVALLITLCGVIAFAVALVLVAVVPAVLAFLQLPGQFEFAITILRWVLLLLLIALLLGLLYRYAPSARLLGVPKRAGFTPGALVAAILWLLASALFSWYASSFGDYNKTYGAMGAVVILLLWFSLGAYAVLLGAEVDTEYAHDSS